jgi:hypothetical protein
METLEEIMSRLGNATFQRRKPKEDLSKYIPIRVTEANLGPAGGMTARSLTSGPDYLEPSLADVKKSRTAKEVEDIPEWLRNAGPREQSTIFVSNNTAEAVRKAPLYREYVKQHELNHVLSNRANPQDERQLKHPLYHTVGPGDASAFMEDLRKTIGRNKLQLIAKYPELGQSNYIVNPERQNLEELMSDLAAIEDVYGVDLTKEPALKDVFRSSRNLSMYRASTGYRRTRMDARDPAPYDPKGYR